MNAAFGRLFRAVLLAMVLSQGQTGPSLAARTETTAAQAATVEAQASAGPTIPAGSTLSAQPSILSATVKPGETYKTTVTLTAGVPLDIKINSDGLGQEPDGAFRTVAQSQDSSPYSARAYVDVSPGTLALKAGDARDVTVSVRVPSTAGEGTRYAILQVIGTPVGGGGNVGIGVTLGVSVVVALAGTTQTRSGRLDNLVVADTTSGQPLDATALLMNTGNVHFGAAPNTIYATGRLLDAGGSVITSARTTLTGNSLVPTFGRSLKVRLDPGRPLSDGRYQIVLEAGLQDGTILDRAALAFTENHGRVLGATDVPAIPAGSGPNQVGDLAILIAVLLGAGAMALIVAALRRRGQRSEGASSGGSARDQ